MEGRRRVPLLQTRRARVRHRRPDPEIRFPHLAAHIWFSETHTALHKKASRPFLGRQNGTAYYLLYNGILGDKRPNGGNVLTAKVLNDLPAHDGQKVIYGEACRIGCPQQTH